MSETLATAMDNVRFLTRDRKKSAYAIPSHEMAHLVMHSALELSTEAGHPRAWEEDFLALSVGSSDSSPTTSTAQYSQIIELRLSSNGRVLDRMTVAEMERLRAGDTPPTGEPACYTLIEGAAQVLVFRFHPQPLESDTVDALTSPLPTVGYTDATVLPFSDPFLRTIEKHAAMECVAKLPPSERERLLLDKEVLTSWGRDVARGIRLEQVRLASQQLRPYGTHLAAWR